MMIDELKRRVCYHCAKMPRNAHCGICDPQPSDGALTNEGSEPVAWRNFDGEGNHDFTEDEETAERWAKHNGEKYSDWCQPLFLGPPAPASVVLPRLQMSDVVKAHMDIPRCPVLTSNQCHALAMKLNACLDRVKELNS